MARAPSRRQIGTFDEPAHGRAAIERSRLLMPVAAGLLAVVVATTGTLLRLRSMATTADETAGVAEPRVSLPSEWRKMALLLPIPLVGSPGLRPIAAAARTDDSGAATAAGVPVEASPPSIASEDVAAEPPAPVDSHQSASKAITPPSARQVSAMARDNEMPRDDVAPEDTPGQNAVASWEARLALDSVTLLPYISAASAPVRPDAPVPDEPDAAPEPVATPELSTAAAPAATADLTPSVTEPLIAVSEPSPVDRSSPPVSPDVAEPSTPPASAAPPMPAAVPVESATTAGQGDDGAVPPAAGHSPPLDDAMPPPQRKPDWLSARAASPVERQPPLPLRKPEWLVRKRAHPEVVARPRRVPVAAPVQQPRRPEESLSFGSLDRTAP
ncbi:MAG: hypothetical protein AB7F78_10155 [Hyphomicrobiaceae bacterium]